jgi:hypothetical protein
MAKAPESFPLPKEVKDLPPELARHGPLTAKQRKKDLAYRDKNFQLQGTAARLTQNEFALNQARIGIQIYRTELERLEGKLKAKRLPRGERKTLKRAREITVNNLADAYFEHGDLYEAWSILVSYDADSDRARWIHGVVEAIARPDHEHCKCPATKKHVAREIYLPERARLVPLITCACGYMNVSEQRPPEMVALEKARSVVPEGASDEAIVKLAEKFAGDR